VFDRLKQTTLVVGALLAASGAVLTAVVALLEAVVALLEWKQCVSFNHGFAFAHPPTRTSLPSPRANQAATSAATGAGGAGGGGGIAAAAAAEAEANGGGSNGAGVADFTVGRQKQHFALPGYLRVLEECGRGGGGLVTDCNR
jgi:hypothetical protein